jgi:23S rRNA (cytidine2498-2'-O)-methyltransferase
MHSKSTNWLAQVGPEFYSMWAQIIQDANPAQINSLGNNFYSVKFSKIPSKNELTDSFFSRYWMPVDYMWPTNVNEKGFIEKCSQGLMKKFQEIPFKNVIVFSSDRKKSMLASNLRGRLLQVMDKETGFSLSSSEIKNWTKFPNSQPSEQQVLAVCLADKCVYAGITSPKISSSFFGGGRHYVSVDNKKIASRAASKFVEASDLLKLYGIDTSCFQNWLELGAAPGGISYELCQRNHKVWAIDKADLQPDILSHPNLKFFKMDARDFKSDQKFDAIFCDLNGPSEISTQICSEKANFLKKNSLIIYTFKIHHKESFRLDLVKIISFFEEKKFMFFMGKHLYNNKQEITLFFSNNL